VLHVEVHAPLVHAVCAWATVVVHPFPHAPQLLALLAVLTQVVPHNVGSAAGHPEAHANVPPLPEHTAVAPEHAVLQPPQVAACEMSVSQPSAGLPLQSIQPGAHDEAANAQAPAVHDAAPLTCARPLQSLPQTPQLAVSVVTSTHAPSQSVYPALHVEVQAPLAHAACAWATVVEHAFPQAPQLPALLAVLTHVMPHAVGVAAGHPPAHA